MAIKVEELLQPVAADNAAGPSLEYDPQYLQLLKAAEGVREQQMGDQIIEAVPPDWMAVGTGAAELLKRSKDLRAAVCLDMALCRTEGLPGLRDGLQLLKGLVEAYWDGFHPKLEPGDNNDPIERMNILRAFASRGSGGGAESPMITALRETPLADSRQAGRFGLKDIAIATGELTIAVKEGQTRPEMPMIQAAARDTSVETLKTARDAAEHAVTLTQELEAMVDSKVGAGKGVDFKEFTRNLQNAVKYLNQFLSYHGEGPPADATAEESGEARSGGAAMSGDIRSTADVTRVLEKVCEFYERTEPSSPIPLLMRRAQRLVGKDFWQVLQELSPEAINAIKTISGPDPRLPQGL